MNKATFKNAWPYRDDPMNLPVADVDASVPFYEEMMGFRVVQRLDTPHRIVIMERDGLRIGLAENGGDASQDGVAFEVDDIEAAFEELKENGLATAPPGGRDPNGTISAEIGDEEQNDSGWRVFYIVAPDGLCFWIGQRET